MARSVGGSSSRYSCAASSTSSDYDDELEESPNAYYEYAAAAVGSGSPSWRNEAGVKGASTPPQNEAGDLADILIPTSYSPTQEALGPSIGRSTQREHSPRYQEYYDILEMANNRLSMTAPPERHSSGESSDAVILGEVGKKKRSKKKKKKEKKEKRKKRKQEEDHEEEEVDIDQSRRSSVFQAVFQPSLFEAHSNKRKPAVSSEAEILSALGMSKKSNSFADEENGIDPNDEIPAAPGSMSWSPAALVNASRSKQSGGKTDQQGYYAQVGISTPTRKSAGFGSIMEKVQNLMQIRDKELPKHYNLNSIGRSDVDACAYSGDSGSSTSSPKKTRSFKRRKYKNLAKHESIDWGDESAIGGHEEERVLSHKESPEIEMKVVDDLSDSDNNDSTVNWDANVGSVEKLVWYRDRRKRLGVIVTIVFLFLTGCSALYFSGGYEKIINPNNQDAENIPDSDNSKNDHPIYPLPPPPPIDLSIILSGGFNGTSMNQLSEDDVKAIIKKVTSDISVLSNPSTPQAKAMTWSLEDRTKFNVEVPVRVGVRYALATLYYATNGDKWVNKTNWLSGHECLWNGIDCVVDANDIASVAFLNLVSNNLDGTIPQEVGYIESLQRIQLGSNKLVGLIPKTFADISELRTLSLSDNQLSGAISSEFDGLKKLTNLDLANNRFHGHIPYGLGGIPTLSYIRLSNNRFTGSFPTSFISLNSLQTLLIDNNAIGGTLPALIGMLRTLVNLRLHKNDFYGDLPNFSDAVYLETAHFDDNFFKGPLPQFGSQRLRELYFDKNEITGPIPISYGSHPKLQILSARNNDLSSSIPASLGSATSLGILDLSYNKLTGELSQDLSHLSQLKKLYLNNNRLQGSFPPWVGSLSNLSIAHFNNNMFSGTLNLSYDFENLDYLTEFTIENNGIVGRMPEEVCDLLLSVLTADCLGNPAAVDCPCCTKCYGGR